MGLPVCELSEKKTGRPPPSQSIGGVDTIGGRREGRPRSHINAFNKCFLNFGEQSKCRKTYGMTILSCATKRFSIISIYRKFLDLYNFRDKISKNSMSPKIFMITQMFRILRMLFELNNFQLVITTQPKAPEPSCATVKTIEKTVPITYVAHQRSAGWNPIPQRYLIHSNHGLAKSAIVQEHLSTTCLVHA